MKKFSTIFGNGCSFVQGCDLNGIGLGSSPVEEVPGRFTDILAKRIGAKEVNLGAGGAGNDRIFRTTMEWIDENLEEVQSSPILFCIGLSANTRSEIWSNSANNYLKANFNSLTNRSTELEWYIPDITSDDVEEFTALYYTEFYNKKIREKEHYYLMKGLLAYIKEISPKSKVFLFNSLGTYSEKFRNGLKMDRHFFPNWHTYNSVDASQRGVKNEFHPTADQHLFMANYIYKNYIK